MDKSFVKRLFHHRNHLQGLIGEVLGWFWLVRLWNLDVVSEKDAYSSQERICCLRSYYNYFESYLEKLVIQPQYSTYIYIFYDFFLNNLR